MTTNEPPDYRELLQRSLEALDTMEAKLDAAERRRREPIAIVGMGVRFPGGANDPESFWELLMSGRDAIGEIPPDRWDVEAMFDPSPDAAGKSYTRWGGFIDGVDEFDAAFFGISPREAVSMDPQQRLLLEVAWEALEHAGLPPSSLVGTRTGVFTGIIGTEYADLALRGGIMAEADAYFASGVAHSVAAGRLAYVLDLRGPAVAVDTACSSSLVATHLACQALRNGECDAALAGGVSVMLSPDAFVLTSRARMMSFEGRCKTFDAGADGYVRGEGAALLVLKRLSDARDAGDRILAVIRGTCVNQDGRSNGLTAPNAAAQEAVIRGALADAGLEPAAVSFVECHGTGTTLGDPIEVRALQAVFGAGRLPERPLLVQSVKTNIGHLEAAAGIAGLCKLVLALGRGELPAHLHLTRPNPYIPWQDIAVAPLAEPERWEQPDGARRVGGVSSFGFSGTNAHLILEEPPQAAAQEGAPSRPHRVYPVSAPTGDALDELAAAHAAVLQRTDVAFASAAATATTGRAHLAERLAVVAADPSEAANRLTDAVAGGRSADAARATARRGDDGVVMLFTGQGSQAAGMGRQLYATESAFRASLDRSATVLKELGFDLLAVMFGDGPGPEGLTIDDTRCAQPALFAFEVAMAALWRSWGVEPAAVIGHSIGELAAAHVAGVLSLADALAVVDARGRLMQRLPRTGGMAAVFADEALVREAIEPWAGSLSIAALNGPRRVVISGHLDALDAVVAKLEAESAPVTRLHVSHAFHSPLMDPMLDELEQVVASATLAEPVIELISNRTAQVAPPGLLTTARYWREHVREAVRFGESVRHAVELGYRSFLEVGPGPTLTGLAVSCEPPSDAVLVASVQRPDGEARDVQRAVATLHVHGVGIDWRAYEGPVRPQPVSLPTAAFRRDRFRHPRAQPDHGPAAAASGSRSTSLLGDELRSPKIAGHVFERRLSSAEPAWLSDHVIYGATLVPATAYLELMRRAGQAAGTTTDVFDVRFDTPLVMDERDPTTIQTIVEVDGAEVGVFSDHATGGWQRHATGRLAVPEDDDPSGGRPSPLSSLGGSTELEAVWSRADQTVEGGDYYAALLRLGAAYGPRFRGIERAARREGEAVAALRAPAPEREPDALHPGLADSCLQVLGLAMPGGGDLANVDGDAYLPVAVERWHVPAGAPDRCREGALLTAVALVRPTNVESDDLQPGRGEVIGEVTLFDADGALVAALDGVHLVRAPRTVLRSGHGDPAEWTYLPEWVAAPLPETEGRSLEGRLLVVGVGALGAAIADAISRSGGTVEVVDPTRRPGADVGPAVGTALEDGIDGVVVALAGAADGRAAAWDVADTIAHVVRLRPDATITVVTVGAMAVVPGDSCVGAPHASAWGVGRVALAEHPALALRLLDLTSPDAVESVVAELLAGDRDEPQVAWRDGERYALRLARGGDDQDALTLPDGPYRLVLEEAGRLDGLRLAEQEDLAPGPGELLIDVRATGLNFRDVLNALGTYAGDDTRLGGECAGTVLAVGDGVERVRVGDRVMAVAGAGFASRCVVPEAMAAHPPAGSSDAEAASLPIAFLTASYGLERLGGMKAGDRVLIHAAAGGVGMAAVRLALAAGAEIYATAGSPAKRAALADLGVQHVYSSRSLDFREQIRHDTGGEGVDLVLNSLSGDSIAASLDVLAPGGRFLEIGMAGIWDHEQVRAVRPDAEYHVIYLGDVCVQRPELIAELLDELVARFDRGALRRPPITAFDIRQAVAAFRYMAQARHIGKVVVTASVGWTLESAGGTWIITGGLGGLGLTVAAELADAGAERLVLCSRSAAGEDQDAALAVLRATGADVRVVPLDVADGEAVAAMVRAVTADGMRLTGVVHAAGVVDDGLLVDLTAERFETVARVKVTGAEHLAAATDPHHPDHFVLFSAGAGLLGAPGQANYAAANAALDALAWRRRAAGRPAESVDWGPWKEVGMAAGLGAAALRRWDSQGIVALDPADGRRAFRAALGAGNAQAAVLDLRWPTLLQHFSKHTVPSIFRQLATSEHRRNAPADAPAAGLVPALLGLPIDRRRDRLVSEVRGQLLRVLGLEANHPIDARRGLTDLGMDSLMAVELSNRLSALVDRALPSTLALEEPTLEALSRHLEGELADRVAFVAAAVQQPVQDELSDLSVDELTAALVRELDDAGY